MFDWPLKRWFVLELPLGRSLLGRLLGRGLLGRRLALAILIENKVGLDWQVSAIWNWYVWQPRWWLQRLLGSWRAWPSGCWRGRRRARPVPLESEGWLKRSPGKRGRIFSITHKEVLTMPRDKWQIFQPAEDWIQPKFWQSIRPSSWRIWMSD